MVQPRRESRVIPGVKPDRDDRSAEVPDNGVDEQRTADNVKGIPFVAVNMQ